MLFKAIPQALKYGPARPLISKRSFYMWLNFVFNRLDYRRLEEYGPDRVAAEWILRCGGGVKFKSWDNWLRDYNSLAQGPGHKFKLQMIDARDTCVTTGGLLHLDGLEHLENLSLHGCKYVTDLNYLHPVKDSLTVLDIAYCPGITDITPLEQLSNLKKLDLTGNGIKDKDNAIAELLKTLPACEVTG